MTGKALFLDRDGVVNVDRGYVCRREDFQFQDGLFDLCRHFQGRGYKIVIATNQSGIARGYFAEEDLLKLHGHMLDELRREGVAVADILYCPSVDDAHPDRKPNPGMFLKARDAHGLDMAASVSIGDKERDILAAKKAGVGANVLLTKNKDAPTAAQYRIGSLREALYVISGEANSSTVSIEEAWKLGYKECFLTYAGIGDNIGLYFAAQTYFERTGKKLLLSMHKDIKILFKNMNYANFLDGFSCHDMAASGYDNKCRILSNYGINPVFVSTATVKNLGNDANECITLWPDKNLIAKYCERIGLSGQVAVCPHIVLTDGEKKQGRFFQKSQIAIMSDGLLKYKTWPSVKTQALVKKLKKHYSFVQIGKKSDSKIKGALDKRGQKSLRDVASILYNSDLFVGGIGGLGHLARSVNCRSVIAYSSAEPIGNDIGSLGSYACNENVLARNGCDLCGRNLLDPQHQPCPNSYSCIEAIEVDDMAEAIHKQMRKVRQKMPLEVDVVSLTADKSVWMNAYHAMLRTAYNADSMHKKAAVQNKINFVVLVVKIFKKSKRILAKIKNKASPAFIAVEVEERNL